MQSTSGANIAPKTLNGENDLDTLCLQAIHDLMKDGASRNKLSPRDVRALKRAKINDNHNETEVSILGSETASTVTSQSPESSDSTCTRTIEHPMHVFQRLYRRILWTLGQINKTKMTSKIKSDYSLTN